METGLGLLRLRSFLGVRDKILFQFVVVRPPAGGLTFREIREQKAECWYLAAGRCIALHCLLSYRCTWLQPPVPVQCLSWFPANFHQSRQARSVSPLSPRGNVFLGLGSHLLTSDSGFKFLTNTFHTSYSLNSGADSAEPRKQVHNHSQSRPFSSPDKSNYVQRDWGWILDWDWGLSIIQPKELQTNIPTLPLHCLRAIIERAWPCFTKNILTKNIGKNIYRIFSTKVYL